MFILGISGKRGAGKDLLANILHYRGFRNFPFAGALKEKVRQDFQLTKEQTDGKLKEVPTKLVRMPNSPESTDPNHGFWTPRQIMIEYGQFFRQFDKDFWVRKVFESLKAQPDNSLITISDVRFKNEANYIKEQGGFLIRLERNPKLNMYGEPIDDISEKDLDNYDGFDYIVPQEHNETPQDLERVADKLLEVLKKKVNVAKVL